MSFARTVLLSEMRCLTFDPSSARSVVSENWNANLQRARLHYHFGYIK
ncbi:hypothetical protein BLL52_2840 [Rhodoferax antarcticus ANT.BR]|uniref:Uncharacterized protein n=1 Tax=Rhodoferax antarcticus ANT.BR TaxID=1111071 RepID=A0A1Q8YEV5_9BURK|nr:hypothetical protein BLL52_2840 [Rhodoferax antarcticus ANT.BR]